MANSLTTGLHWASTLPSWQRDYYSLLLLETLRTKSILVPFALMKEDFAAANSGVVIVGHVWPAGQLARSSAIAGARWDTSYLGGIRRGHSHDFQIAQGARRSARLGQQS